jgi:uncharacterized 2Fe-2S/4Fe-4S cluster protein (DUF4445 family)
MNTTLHLQALHRNQTIHPDPATDPRGLADLLAFHGLPLNTRCAQNGCCESCTVQLDRGSLKETISGNPITHPGPLLACRAEWIPGTEIALTIPSRSLLARDAVAADDFQISVPVGNSPLFSGEFGLAVDIGTTTVVVLLAELATGRILTRASGFNQQVGLGDDVLARIGLCYKNPGMVIRLQRAICEETLAPLALEACAKASIPPERISGMAVAGNTAMLHLLFGEDPSPLGVVPFTPRFLDHRIRGAHSLGFCDFPDMPVHALPGLAAYVGADIAAGLYATGLHDSPGPALFVDVGTNGEIALLKEGRLYACATAAGPAFEGCSLSCGMRATEGAVEGIALSLDQNGQIAIHLQTIGHLPPEQSPGFCGSAYIDFLAQARAAGILMENGRFDPKHVAANPALFQDEENGRAMRLTEGEPPLRITESDLAILLQSKAAIAAGIQTLLERERLAGVPRLYLAGGFGMHLDVPHAIACGLLPGFLPSQVEVVGNTSLGGAYLAMLDRSVLKELTRLQTRTTIVELNLDPEFENRYIDNLTLA